MIWIVGAAILVLKYIGEYIRLQKYISSIPSVEDERINEILKQTPEQLIVLSEILLFLSSISSNKNEYLQKVAEFDTPDNLLKKKGLFAKLYYENLQGIKNA